MVRPCNSLRVDTKQSTHYNALCAVHVAGPDRSARVRSTGRLGTARDGSGRLGTARDGIGTLGTLGTARNGIGALGTGRGQWGGV